MKKETFPHHNNQSFNIRFLICLEGGLKIHYPQENETIKYTYQYHRMIITEFERKEGSEWLTFLNEEIISKQRSVMGYLLKKIGSNLLSGKSIMNICLPINIFDVRSHLEV